MPAVIPVTPALRALVGNLPGKSRGTIGHPPPKLGAIKILTSGFRTGAVVTPEPPPAPPPPLRDAVVASDLSIGSSWWDRVHVLPRQKTELGLIRDAQQVEFEVFNASRQRAVVVAVDNLAGDGVTLPDGPAVGTPIAPFGSALVSPSTPTSPTLPTVDVSPDGAPEFDSSIRFVCTPGGEAELLLSGSRFEVLPFEPEGEVIETLEFGTDVLMVSSGIEKRISYRKRPRQKFELNFLVSGTERALLHAMLFNRQHRAFGIPLWHERIVLSAPASIGATSFTAGDGTLVDLRVGGWAVLFHDRDTFDVVRVASVNSTTVTVEASPATTNAFVAGDFLMPLRIAYLDPRVPTRRPPVGLELISLLATVAENDLGARDGQVDDFFEYESRPIIDLPNVMQANETGGDVLQNVVVFDFAASSISQSAAWSTSKRRFEFGFSTTSRGDMLVVRDFLLAMRGRQGSFWIPSAADDFEVVADLASGSDTVDVSLAGYTRHVQSRRGRSSIAFTFIDGSSLIRTILSSVEVSGTVERLTLDDTWPFTISVGAVRRVQYLELVRFDSDSIQIRHKGIARARGIMPVVEVLEDP